MAKPRATWLTSIKIAAYARLRGSNDRESEDPPRAGYRPPWRAPDHRRLAVARDQAVGRAAQGRGRRRGQRRLADDRRSARALQPDARGICLVAAGGRSFRHAGPAGDAHPALPRSLRAPAQVLIRAGRAHRLSLRSLPSLRRRGERILLAAVYPGRAPERADNRRTGVWAGLSQLSSAESPAGWRAWSWLAMARWVSSGTSSSGLSARSSAMP